MKLSVMNCRASLTVLIVFEPELEFSVELCKCCSIPSGAGRSEGIHFLMETQVCRFCLLYNKKNLKKPKISTEN